MAVPSPRSNVEGGNAIPERWVVRPRVALFNSSSMNNIDNEIVQIGSELLTHFGDTKHARVLADNLTFLDQALHHARGIDSMLALRRTVLTGEPAALQNGWTKGRLFWSWIADPICAVHIRRVLADKEAEGDLSADERTVLVQLEGLTNGLVALFKGIVGSRNNSVIASMPLFLRVAGDEDNGYPRNFTLDEVDYCNLMYWIILPILGARVYNMGAQASVGEPFQIPYREHELDLSKELGLTEADRLTVTRLTGNCAFSKVAPGRGTDVSELFEPTASRHKRCTDVGFSETSVVTYVWAIRVKKLAEISNNGCGASLMQQKSALFTLSTQMTCKPTAHNTHQLRTMNQCIHSVVIPETLESPGVYIPNLYMKDVRGGDMRVNTGGPFDMVVTDAFNGFCADSDSASGYRGSYIFTKGRSERLNGTVTRDPLMRTNAYACMLVEFQKGVLDPIGDPFKDTVERVSGDKRGTDIMLPTLGVAFCGTYGIGPTSDKKLMSASDATRETQVDRLAPRISGTGMHACNPIPTTSRIITPIFERIFASTRYSRVLQS
ncbi:hypothetical protein KUCAC02_007733 [Chaenocephalus aceratus]|uniref:Uncharacterized protein n=1 Tax=Chaenocephalus aceratus TaxID=36190 RepID=A0ACB9X6C0_CHAAC|nr:hypothetical protein KUCAC02_007733 [Chaenocephalus aceratus]